jgi:hypothetical protein
VPGIPQNFSDFLIIADFPLPHFSSSAHSFTVLTNISVGKRPGRFGVAWDWKVFPALLVLIDRSFPFCSVFYSLSLLFQFI